jgi:hypothetical protein
MRDFIRPKLALQPGKRIPFCVLLVRAASPFLAPPPPRFSAPYEQIADAPGATRHVRRFIVDLEVRRKLVPQEGRFSATDRPHFLIQRRCATE